MSKRVTIAEVCRRSPIGVLVLHADLRLEAAIRRFAADPTTHGIVLADDSGRLVGVVNNHDLLDWARLQFDLFSRDFMLPVARVRRLLAAVTIGDLALPDSRRMAVRLHDTLETALHVMAQFGLADIVVLDDAGRVVNDLRLSELLSYALEVRAQETAGDTRDVA